MDCRRLKAGQNWDFEIRTALDNAAIIVIFISRNSIDRRGYVQREIKLALDKFEEKLIGDIYIIPVLLDSDCRIPDQLKQIHCVKAWEGNAFSEIEEAINHQLCAIGAEVQAEKDRASINWHKTTYREAWEGLPGYQAEFDLLNFSSIEYPQINDITTFLHGELIKDIMDQRQAKFSQNPESMSFGEDAYRRTNTLHALCEEPIIAERIISIVYKIHWYGAGAAHPNMYFRTYSFFLDPVVLIGSLVGIFDDEKAAFEVIQRTVREQLLASHQTSASRSTSVERSSTEDYAIFIPSGFDADWVRQGTSEWKDFEAYILRSEGIEILFAPYNVASYVDGPQSATVPYDMILEFLCKHYAEALGLGYRKFMLRREQDSA
jgi:hypothetical protein